MIFTLAIAPISSTQLQAYPVLSAASGVLKHPVQPAHDLTKTIQSELLVLDTLIFKLSIDAF